MATFTGTSTGDIYTSGGENDDVTGNGGNDRLSGGTGNDTIEGDGGADSLVGGDGDDQLFSHTRYVAPNLFVSVPAISYDVFTDVDTLIGGNGDDYIFAGYGDSVDGGPQGSYGNRLFISFLGSSSGVQADFRPLREGASVTIGGGVISNIQTVGYLEGSNFDDFLVPVDTYYPTGPNIYGRGGNDHIIADYYSGWAGSGIWGGDGNDDIDATTAQYGPKVYGEAGDDTIHMRGAGDVAYGGDGNDTISAGGEVHGGNGNDRIDLLGTYYPGLVYGDAGDDVINAPALGNPYDSNPISGGAGADTLTGSAKRDILISGDFLPNGNAASPDNGLEHDVIVANGGDDVLAAGYGDDVDGGDGSDTLSLSLGGSASGVTIDLSGIAGAQPYVLGGGTIKNIETLDRLVGSAFADTITVGTQSALVIIDGGNGDDVVTSASSSVEFNGGAGDDRFVSGIAGDRFDGGNGFDTADYSAYAGGIAVTLGATPAAQGSGPGGDALISVERVIGSSGADMISGGQAAEALSGGAGNDTLDGGAGADTMTGGVGDDVFTVDNSGDQVIESVGGGTDSVTATANWAMTAGQEIETITAGGSAALNLTGNELGNNLSGNEAANALSGLAGADALAGAGGNDTLDGGAGDDQLAGGVGHDVLLGGDGADMVSGGDGNDHLFGQSANGGADGADTLLGENGSDYLQGNAGNDLLLGGDGSDRINGGADNDTLLGADGNDTINGNRGADMIYGGEGNDSLRGGQDMDTIEGGEGNDTLTGDLGRDFLTGGGGSDLFAFGGRSSLFGEVDFVLDFEDGTDRLLVGYHVDAVLGGMQVYTPQGALSAAQQVFDAHVGNDEVAVFKTNDSDIYLIYSSNHDGTADSMVQLSDLTPAQITIADFI